MVRGGGVRCGDVQEIWRQENEVDRWREGACGPFGATAQDANTHGARVLLNAGGLR